MQYRAVVAEGKRLPFLLRGVRLMSVKPTHKSKLRVMRATLREQLPAPAGLKK
jgi:hypothetical protein